MFAAASCILNGLHCIWETVFGGSRRADGFYFYMTTATIICMWCPLALIFVLEAFEKKKYRGISVLSLIFMIAVLLCNQTRGAWLATAITFFTITFMFVRSKKKALCVFVSLVVALGIVFACVPQLNNRLNSISQSGASGERFLIWTSVYHMFLDRPILGIGFNEFKEKYQKQYILPEAKETYLMHAHNNFMQVLAEGGILGAVTWTLFWGYALWMGIYGWKKHRELAYLAWFAVVAGFQLHGLTEYTQGNSAATKEFWLIVGIFLQLMWLSGQDKKRKLS